jgi:hypothetical protein
MELQGDLMPAAPRRRGNRVYYVDIAVVDNGKEQDWCEEGAEEAVERLKREQEQLEPLLVPHFHCLESTTFVSIRLTVCMATGVYDEP